MKHLLVSSLAISALLMAGCTSTPKVSVRQPGDQNLTCTQLISELDQLQSVQEEAQHNQGINTANVTAVLFFWPAAVGNYMEADRALDLAEERQNHLMDIYDGKNCER